MCVNRPKLQEVVASIATLHAAMVFASDLTFADRIQSKTLQVAKKTASPSVAMGFAPRHRYLSLKLKRP